jgi:hypothetical protein
MKFLSSMLLVAGLLCSTTLLANEPTGPIKITSLINWIGTRNNPNEVVLVKTNQSQLTNPANCSKTDVYYLDVASEISRSMLLTAFTAKINVNLNIYSGGCSSDDRPLIISISLVE